jgi:hypothetical protein
VSLNSPVWKLPKLRASTLREGDSCSQKDLIAMLEYRGAAANV